MKQSKQTPFGPVLIGRTCDGCKTKIPTLAGCHHDFPQLKLEFSFLRGCKGDNGYSWKVEDLCEDCAALLYGAILALRFTIVDSRGEEKDNG